MGQPRVASPRRRVLVADDIQAMSALMRSVLTSAGYDVDVASDGEECVTKARAFRPELILMDIMMPRLHGLDALQQIRADPDIADVGVIICTLKDFKPDQTHARELGVAGFIVKPFQPQDLVDTVRAFFHGESVGGDGSGARQAVEMYVPKLPSTLSSMRLWGTRGSVPVSGQPYVRHGGNTSCVAFEAEGEMLVLDAGTGIRELGETLATEKPRKIHLFISHTHWDHIQGFPFFVPAYRPGFEINVWGAAGFGKNLESIFAGQLDRHYFPVQLEDMRATFTFQHLRDNPVEAGPFKVYWEYTHHPGPAVAFKVEVGGRRVGYVSDNEFLKGYLGAPEKVVLGSQVLAPCMKLVDFVSNVDVLLAEAQYTNEEYAARIGWGHSSVSNACLLAALGKVPRWVVTHHEPRHSDEMLQEKLNLTRHVLEGLGHKGIVTNGFDGFLERF
jgi:CheY-like chemotaxis protein